MAKKQKVEEVKQEEKSSGLVRDENGYGVAKGFEDFPLPDEGFAPGAVVNGKEVFLIALVDDHDATPIASDWLSGNVNISAWQPKKPDGDNWELVIVAELDEGPFAVFARPGVHGVATGKEYAQEFLLGSLIKACIKHMKTMAKPWGELKESEQSRVLGTVMVDCRDALKDAIDIIVGNGRVTFTAAVDQVVFKDGVKAVLSLAKTPEAHALADAEGSYVTIVIEERKKLLQEGDSTTPEKDQKPLFDASKEPAVPA